MYNSKVTDNRGIQKMQTLFGFFRKKKGAQFSNTVRMEAETTAVNIPANIVIRCEAGEILQPVKGKVISQTEIPDGIKPEEDIIAAPYEGEISVIADSKHSIGITGAGNMKLLIHVGIGTVAMNGDGFTPLVAKGDRVQAGQRILKFDRSKIKSAGYSDMVVVVLTNSDNYKDVTVAK